ncbi:GGDEF domain-containing protein [Deinococcus peraridilitoris]|uniref:Diguanylate cyclase (GGDEF) domain-containing protein n=1 Tax=Deinococcus peraridilitoris (strain DSM 19664 / LMG 22246 / CIP 109416 / KR-200) TaxID=937777 RepID=K9ZZ13_DEIPD|nr:sensor domain-containing diguanylate cyclase [Deinococcus peraridilitoris]AFZ66836.1 diguanylate cyclase (GGDEF) domain-containing protein [Deinococcus peraridilitoris DSM 19664]
MTGCQTELETLRLELAQRNQLIRDLHDELSRERQRGQVLYQLSRTLDLQRLLSLLDDTLQRLGLFDAYLITFHDVKSGGLICRQVYLPASFAGMQALLKDHRFSVEEPTPIARAYREAQTVVIHLEDIDQSDSRLRQGFEWWQATSLAAIPIPYADGVIGVINGFRQHGRIERQQLQVLEEHLELYNAPLRHALLLGELKQDQAAVEAALEKHAYLLRFITEINALTSVQRIFEVTLEQLLPAYHFDLAVLGLVEDGVGLVIRQVSIRDPGHEELRQRLLGLIREPAPLDITYGASVYALLQNTPLLIADADAVRHLPMTPADRAVLEAVPEIRTILHTPIREHGRAVGILSLMSLSRVQVPDAKDQELIELLASFVGTVITSAQLYEVVEGQKSQIEALNRELQKDISTLDEAVRRDALTGLLNFGAFGSELQRRIDEAQHDPEQAALSVVLLDIDHFKVLNDTYGHLAGNMVLQELAQRLGQALRSVDVACRFGGEEFAVILPQCDLDGALMIAERLRQRVSGQPFQVDGRSLVLTISLGVAKRQPGEGGEALLARADEVLYRAKTLGRNRVELSVSGEDEAEN